MAVSTHVTLGHRIEALGWSAYLGLFGAMSIERASGACARLVQTLGPMTSGHTTAIRNLRLAFPNETEAWRQDVRRAMWAGIGRAAGEFPHLHEINAYQEGGRIEVTGAERLDAVKASGKGAVFISGHFANWELMPAAIVLRGVTCHMTYRPANNPLVDASILRVRGHYGANLQAAKGKEGGMGLLRSLKAGHAVALMNDQKYNEGVAAPLFGHDCMTADGPTRLALRFCVPLIPFSIRRLPGARYAITVHEALPLDRTAPQEQAIADSVARINAFMEARIREAPEDWFWVHKRWPKEAWAKAGV
jgi:Kdo2-lipid IVA lauroyltransferase/acyltransferase